MANQPLKGWARINAAWRNSARGFGDIWRGEEAFRMEVGALVLGVPLAVWLSEEPLHAAVLIASILLVIIVEIINSAIEAVVDRIGPERHELSRIAKDLGSLAVLVACAVPALVWGATLIGIVMR